MKTLSTLLSLLCATVLHADPRASTNYRVATDTADAGGKRATSASYTNDGSAGGVVGTSTVAAPAETAKHGYLGQLYEVTSLQVAATPTTVNEGSTRQLAATATLDDATTAALLGTDVSWSVVSGPFTGISSNGLATAGNVYQDTAATVQASYSGVAGTLGLTVVNVGTDDFGLYASDGLPDAWQVLYFGQNNPNAAPLLDPDHDGFNNLFEFTAGIDPIDALSVFHWRIDPVPGFPGQKKLTFSPRFGDRSYTVKTSATLGTGAMWNALTGSSTSDNGSERTVTDTAATGSRRFYTVEIVKP